MQFPESWLRAFCNPPLNTQQLADTLTMAGLEVEDLRPVAPAFSGVVVAEITAAEPHPDADRLRVCTVNVGGAEPLQIVCGAPNARVGIKVPCALVGAALPPVEEGGKPFKIKIGKLRGVASHGMLCSARELGIADDSSGLLELAADAPLGQNIRDWLHLDDMLFTLKLTPNLAHALSVYGIAREVSALTGTPLQALPQATAAVTCDDSVAVHVHAPDLCGRFSGRVIRGVNTRAQTPAWMVERLARCGQRSVSPLVDISNYVMFEQGQPTHIFDRDTIAGSVLHVRWAQQGEQLELLNGNTVVLDEQVGVIADAQVVESLAGVMGGQATAVSDATCNVYVESAFWWPRAIAGRARRYNFSTDAAHRFERGVDPARTVQVVERITELVQQICGGSAGPISDAQPHMPQPQPVQLRVARAARVIGMPVSAQQCLTALQGLGLDAVLAGDVITVTPPTWRFDIQIEEDLIEEVARVLGYENLPATAPVAPVTPYLRAETLRDAYDVRRQIAQLGYQETINYSFVQERWEHELAGNTNPVRLMNPIASHMSVMRSSLIGSLVNVLRYNLDRKASRVRIFEVGRVFMHDASVPDSDTTVAGFAQPMRVAGLAWGAVADLQWGEKERHSDFYDIKGDVQALLAPHQPRFEASTHPAMHPGRCARVLLGDRVIGFVGELHPRWCQGYDLPHAPVLFELDWQAVLQRPMPHPGVVSKFQMVERDVAVIVKEHITHDTLLAAVRSIGQGAEWIRDVVVFDVFRSSKKQPVDWLQADEKSVALRLTLLNPDAALGDEQIESIRQAVLAQLQAATGARLRG